MTSLSPISATIDNQTIAAVIATPAALPAPGLVLFHDFRGLGDETKAIAENYARAGFLTLAVDLYRGRSSHNRLMAAYHMLRVDPLLALRTSGAWVYWLKSNKNCTGKVATLGWGFGGRWALYAAVESAADAAVLYYGRVLQDAHDFARLKGPVLAHFADGDASIPKAAVETFAAEMKAAGKDLAAHWYDAGHGFANPTAGAFDPAAAATADERTLAFLKQALVM
jgi:carboxymethylenebutenolidase